MLKSEGVRGRGGLVAVVDSGLLLLLLLPSWSLMALPWRELGGGGFFFCAAGLASLAARAAS